MAEALPPPGQLPSLDLALGLCASSPLADLLSAMLRSTHELIAFGARLSDPQLAALVGAQVASLRARGRRLEEVPAADKALPAGFGGLDDDRALRDYVQPELDAILDGTARLMGPALTAADAGDRGASALVHQLGIRLFEDLGRVPLQRGWFALDPVVPGQTRFDPARHRALSSQRSPGKVGYVVGVQRIGRRRVDTGALLTPAEVVVGE